VLWVTMKEAHSISNIYILEGSNFRRRLLKNNHTSGSKRWALIPFYFFFPQPNSKPSDIITFPYKTVGRANRLCLKFLLLCMCTLRYNKRSICGPSILKSEQS
jgi:hypothetical protein